MTIKGTYPKDLVTKYFCGLCGFQVPFEKRYFVKLYRRKIAEGYFWIYQSYICPKCGTETSYDYKTVEDPQKAIMAFNLYTDTTIGNDEPDIAGSK